MGNCFVIQPFDGGVYDKRYEGVLLPAIKAAGLEPYRVDQDPGVIIPIEEIEAGIRNSEVCLAEITTDNPNVWYELGYAIACEKPVILICSSERTSRFPFDVQHRHIIKYSPESPKDFDELREAITSRLTNVLKKDRQMRQLAASPVQETSGLEPHEITALVTVMQNALEPDNPPSGYALKNDMEKAGYTEIAAVLAVKRLVSLGMVESLLADNYNGEQYVGYLATPLGEKWLLENQSRLSLMKRAKSSTGDFVEDDLPF